MERVLGKFGCLQNQASLRLLKGSDIVTQQLYDGDHGYIFQAADGRVIFLMPYEDEFSLIGTTEGEWSLHDGPVTISPEETDYLCAAVNDCFTLSISPTDVIWSYAGVRPLYDDNAASDSVVTHRAA